MNKKLGRLIQPGLGLYFAVMICFTLAAAACQYFVLAGLEAIVTAALFVLYLYQKEKRRKDLQLYIQSASNLTDRRENRIESPFPVAMIRMDDARILWSNDQFIAASNAKNGIREEKITDLIPSFTTDWLVNGKTEYPYDVTMEKRRFRIYGTSFRADDPEGTALAVLYFSDLTELYLVRDEYIRSRPVVSLILVDNYDELTKNLNEGAISAMNVKINTIITQWTNDYHGLLKKLERNRYLFVFEKRDLNRAIEEKFSLLENIRQATNPAGVGATISMGLGVDAANFDEGYQFAALSVEMALSRGGDQAVIKDRINFAFYGGHAKETDHRSKVRSRVTANSLMELIGQSSKVFIMGHKNADMDAVGAAVGVRCLCRKKGKEAYIVIDLEKNASHKLLDELRQVPEYRNCFISGQDALLMSDNRSILVVVDTNRPDQVESKPFLESVSKVCVIDHHRRAADYINPVVVNFHEPYASSAAELVTELMQYSLEKSDILPIEAKALMAGIFLDTKSFNIRTGERTFEAAAYLQHLGADTMEVKKLLQSDFQDTVTKYQVIKSAKLYRKEIAIAALNTTTSRELAAAAADEMLNISGISASFVMYPQDDQVIVSARSIGDANVQMILEPLGGGGNAAAAGVQVKNSTVKETLDNLLESINNYYEN